MIDIKSMQILTNLIDQITHDISDICDIDMLLGVGKKTDCVMRLSTTAFERGSAETIRDVKGMAVKFFTEQGNWDWVCLNIPMFFLRDPAKFPAMMRAQRRDPETNLVNPNNWWEWLCENHEALHMMMFQYSDFGTMFNWRSMSGYVGHAYKWVKSDGSWKYVHFFFASDQGPNFEQGNKEKDLAEEDPDYATRDLHGAIERGEFPSWTAKVQVVDPEDAHKLSFNILDITKHWNLGNYPRDVPVIPGRPFGKLTLKRNPKDFFTEIEQLAFAPSHLVPGVEPSEDPILQARLFAYPDAQRYRLGENNEQLPANRCKGNIEQPATRPVSVGTPNAEWLAKVSSKEWTQPNELDYKYPREFWKILPVLRNDAFQEALVVNMSKSVAETRPDVRAKVYSTLASIAADLSERVKAMTEKLVAERV
ncbi:Heme-dependent catalase-like protein [Glarea lozoyensis ATCC 20868]|uniref:Heme-dependent catalase-like protein n=1 Tax=Glarea lozoyensis (strain ATCC 20868 / MF5171) TaxID=1116229 RepID=S3D702_GLAL2|nr:Heme-dependent catalase-like protein [Glarea lozoyensis ATCC 20868]EPE32919.1 Heme-dependent catalase-like protein [Glarea lozoyensis ATCC 20868]